MPRQEVQMSPFVRMLQYQRITYFPTICTLQIENAVSAIGLLSRLSRITLTVALADSAATAVEDVCPLVTTAVDKSFSLKKDIWTQCQCHCINITRNINTVKLVCTRLIAAERIPWL